MTFWGEEAKKGLRVLRDGLDGEFLDIIIPSDENLQGNTEFLFDFAFE